MAIYEADRPLIIWFGFMALILCFCVFGCLQSIKYENTWREACERQGYKVIDLRRNNLCVDHEGRIIRNT